VWHDGGEVAIHEPAHSLSLGSSPALVAAAGNRAQERFIEFFTANIRNRNTRRARHRPSDRPP
jgi:hypothetical protein